MYFNVVMLLALFKYKDIFYKSPDLTQLKLPKVSMIVPAYNEEKTIAASIKSLKKVDYPKNLLEIVVINDGSNDNTSKILKKCTKEKYITFLDNKKNKGKAACINEGIKISKGEFVAVMDADSEVSKDIIKKTIPYFEEKKVGAVTVAVRVKNPKNILQKIVEVEYIIGLSIALKLLSFFNSIHVTPGPFSMYRKSIFSKIGMFDIHNITEDLEIAHRIQKNGYRIECCTATHVNTVTPDTIKSLYIQRKRWYSGALMTFWQHKNIAFNRKLGSFAFILPYMYLIVVLGLSLFVLSSYVGLSNFFRSMSFFTLTNFNIISYMNLSHFDILSLSALSVFAIISMLTVFIVTFIGLKFSNRKVRKMIPGFVGFALLFILYQVFWASSFYSVLSGKKVKWR